MDVSLWVTTDCNLSCKYCYEGLEKEKQYMTKEVIENSINYAFKYLQFIDKNDFRVQIHGGEPFLGFDLIKYIVYRFKEECKIRNIKVSFFTTTNATIMNEEIFQFIKKEMPQISISLDGTKKTHDKYRVFKNGNGSHEITLKNALKLLENSVQVRIRTTFDSQSVNNLYEDVKFLVEKGFKCIVPEPNLLDTNWNEESVQVLENQIIKLQNYMKSKNDVLLSLTYKGLFKLKGNCSGGITSLNIHPDGSIYPCTMVTGNKEFCIGDIYNGVDIRKRDNLLSYSKNINRECDGCKIYSFCKGSRCKMINKLITNDYYKPPVMQCIIERMNYKLNVCEQIGV
ncbi:radical SAM/SPASM domain-containing protein [Paraclostridium bifermentans]|uniref:radical SAM/SPASM domain-containing protein n=1 Tax=Paraclostridium bifermentans TaxID=1490 RepID=UPI0011DDF3D5|nr:radical SAM protein [Paraclostridium bifermentans]